MVVDRVCRRRSGDVNVLPARPCHADALFDDEGRTVRSRSSSPRLPPAPTLLNVLAGLAVFGLGLYWLNKFFEEPDPRARRRSCNLESLAWQDREYVSLRDGWRCTYCGKRVTRSTRHIDHSVSRANGGTNHLNNLRLSCAACNLSKGAFNARQFVAWWRPWGALGRNPIETFEVAHLNIQTFNYEVLKAKKLVKRGLCNS